MSYSLGILRQFQDYAGGKLDEENVYFNSALHYGPGNP
jgi:hypothetical protein